MKINEKEYKLKYTGKTLVVYKEEFGKDMLMEARKIRDNFDFVSIFEICWAMAKTYDGTIPSFDEFMDSITDLTSIIGDGNLIKEMGEALAKGGTPIKEIKKKIDLVANR